MGVPASADDELGLRELAATYSDAMICRDPVAAASCYAEDGTLTAFDEQTLVGRTRIEANFADVLSKYAFIFQMTHQGFVSIDAADPDRAYCRWHISEIARRPDSTAGTMFLGTYRDIAIRTGSGWRFAARRLTGTYVGRIDLPGKHFPDALPAWGGGGELWNEESR